MFLCWWKHTLNSGYELRVSPHRQTDWGKLLIGYCRSDDVSDCRFGRPVVSPCKRTLFILTLCLYTYIFTLIAIFYWFFDIGHWGHIHLLDMSSRCICCSFFVVFPLHLALRRIHFRLSCKEQNKYSINTRELSCYNLDIK